VKHVPLILAAALVGTLLLLTVDRPPVAAAEHLARFSLEKSDAGVWRIDTHTGRVSHCTFELDADNELFVSCLDWAD
jgi:hypothetical protein